MSGGVRVGGCFNIRAIYLNILKYAIGSIVFEKPKARLGIFEKVAIKKPIFFGGYLTPLYVDTFNRYHNEDDLCSYTEAVEIVQLALAAQAVKMENAVLNC
jgi:hypothetical protein